MSARVEQAPSVDQRTERRTMMLIKTIAGCFSVDVLPTSLFPSLSDRERFGKRASLVIVSCVLSGCVFYRAL